MTKLIRQHSKSLPATAQPIPHARLHDLRHLHATTLLLAGVPVHVVAARLGHADPAVTLRVYSHVLREHALGVGDVFAQAVKAAVSKSVSKPGQQIWPGESFRWSEVVVRGGVEPPTFRFSGGRSYQLSYLTVAGGLSYRGAGGRHGLPRGPDGI